MENSTIDKFSFVGGEATSNSDNQDLSKIVTVDLRKQNAIADITFAAKEFSVIAIEAEDRQGAIAALMSGANAVTSSAITPSEMDLVRGAVARGCRIVDEKQTATTEGGKGLTPHFLVFPRAKIIAKLERWQRSIAGEMLNYWRAMPISTSINTEKWSLIHLVSQIELKSEVSLENELGRIIENLKRKAIANPNDLLTHSEMVLNKWYCGQILFSKDGTPLCCVAVLKANTLKLTETILAELEQFYGLWKTGSGSYTLSLSLQDLITRLRTFEVAAEKEFQIAFQKVYAAKNAYEVLKQGDLTLKDNFTSALQSLKFQYAKEIKARSLLLAGEIISRSIFVLSVYQKRIAASDLFLYQLQRELSEDNFLELLDLHHIENFQLAQYRDRLMMRLGKSFIEWDFMSEAKQKILKTEILTKARYLAWESIID